MSNVSQGPGWWLASDGRWYPPQAAPPPPASLPQHPVQTPPNIGAPVGPMRSTNRLAIASLVCSCLGVIPFLGLVMVILGITFGFVARGQIKKTGGVQEGDKAALAGIVVGWVLLAIGIIISIVLLAAHIVNCDHHVNCGNSTTASSAFNGSRAVPTTTTHPRATTTTHPRFATTTTAAPTTTTTRPPATTTTLGSQIGETVKDGDFAFVVQGVQCGAAALAQTVPAGEVASLMPQGAQECLVTMTVSDDGNVPQTYLETNQYATDAVGHVYGANYGIDPYLTDDKNDTLVFPGITITTVVPYQIPIADHLVSLELHDSASSNGVSVNL